MYQFKYFIVNASVHIKINFTNDIYEVKYDGTKENTCTG